MRRLFGGFAVRLVLVTTAFLAVVTLAISLIMTNQYSETLKQQTQSTTLAAFSVAAQRIESLLGNARMASVHAMQNPVINHFLTGRFKTDREYIEARRDMIAGIRDYFGRYSYLNGLIILDDEGMLLGATPVLTFTGQNPSPLARSLVERVSSAQDQRIHWLGAYRTRDFYEISAGSASSALFDQPMVCAIEPRTLNLASGKDTLYVLISMYQSAISDCFSHLDDADSTVALLSQDGLLISERGQSAISVEPDYYSLIDPSSAYGSFEARLDGAMSQLIYLRLESTGWLLTKRVPLEVYNRSTDSLRHASLLICLVALALVCALYGAWAFRFMRPFKRITKVLMAIQNNAGTQRMDVQSGVIEFNLIAGQFNGMMDSIEQLHRREIEAEREVLVLEIQNLQSQINPHFIYNSIASIRWLATILGADKVSDMLVELAEILRPIFSEWRFEWRFKEELDFTSHYMKLMQLRYGADFSVRSDFPEDMLDMYIPRFILQPLLENACEHGKDSAGRIDIGLDIVQGDGDAVIRVQDNGPGMTRQTLDQLRLALKNGWPSSGRGSGIGLCNVHRRIQLYYGEDYGLSIFSEPGAGARIDVRVKMIDQPVGLIDESKRPGGYAYDG